MKRGFRMTFGLSVMVFFLCLGCSSLKKTLSLTPAEYLKWHASADNKFVCQDTANNLVFRIKAYPKEVNIARCALDHCEPKETLLKELKQEESVTSFMLEVRGLNSSKEDLFSPAAGMNSSDKALYLSGGIRKELFAFSSDRDTIFCNSVIYEPSIPGHIRLLIDFDNPEHQPIKRILFNDHSLSMIPVEFQFSPSANSNFPTLNLKNYE